MSSSRPPQGAVGVKPLLKMNSIHRAPGQAPAIKADARRGHNYGCSKGLRSNLLTGSIAPSAGQPRCRPRLRILSFHGSGCANANGNLLDSYVEKLSRPLVSGALLPISGCNGSKWRAGVAHHPQPHDAEPVSMARVSADVDNLTRLAVLAAPSRRGTSAGYEGADDPIGASRLGSAHGPCASASGCDGLPLEGRPLLFRDPIEIWGPAHAVCDQGFRYWAPTAAQRTGT